MDLLLTVLGRGETPSLSALARRDWTGLHDAAREHGVAPLLWHRLRERGATAAAPPEVARELAALHVLGGLRAEARRRQLGEALAALRSRDVPVVPLKGAYLAEHAYPSPAVRPMGDLDLLIPAAALAPAIEALVDVGYVRPDERSHAAYRHHRHFAPLRRPGSLTIELHPVIEPCAPPFRLPLADVWARARPTPTAGEPALALAPEDLLQHLAVHMGRSHLLGASLVSVVDVAVWLARFGAAADWDAVVRQAVESDARRFVYAALGLARAALGAEVPGDALWALRGESDDAAVAEAMGVLRWPRAFPAGSLLLLDPRQEPWVVARRLARELVVDPLRQRRRLAADGQAAWWEATRAQWAAAGRFLFGAASRSAHRRQAARVRLLRDWALEDGAPPPAAEVAPPPGARRAPIAEGRASGAVNGVV